MLSKARIQQVKGEVLGALYEAYPDSLFMNAVAKKIERDNEFVARLLDELASQKHGLKLVERVPWKRRGSWGKRPRWRLSFEAKKAYDARAAKTGENEASTA